ncbi:MAG: hypothetical protein JOY71_17265 [Acetobacteraceae bacterium]|nr:hypothetical protein [Acetobacteraceae bacterium]
MHKEIAIAAASILLSGIHNVRADSESYPTGSAQPVYSSPARADTGSETYPSSTPGLAVATTQGPVLATNGGEGIVQTTNSLPPEFAAGTPGYEYAQSVQRFYATRTTTQRQTQAAPRLQRGG